MCGQMEDECTDNRKKTEKKRDDRMIDEKLEGQKDCRHKEHSDTE